MGFKGKGRKTQQQQQQHHGHGRGRGRGRGGRGGGHGQHLTSTHQSSHGRHSLPESFMALPGSRSFNEARVRRNTIDLPFGFDRDVEMGEEDSDEDEALKDYLQNIAASGMTMHDEMSGDDAEIAGESTMHKASWMQSLIMQDALDQPISSIMDLESDSGHSVSDSEDDDEVADAPHVWVLAEGNRSLTPPPLLPLMATDPSISSEVAALGLESSVELVHKKPHSQQMEVDATAAPAVVLSNRQRKMLKRNANQRKLTSTPHKSRGSMWSDSFDQLHELRDQQGSKHVLIPEDGESQKWWAILALDSVSAQCPNWAAIRRSERLSRNALLQLCGKLDDFINDQSARSQLLNALPVRGHRLRLQLLCAIYGLQYIERSRFRFMLNKTGRSHLPDARERLLAIGGCIGMLIPLQRDHTGVDDFDDGDFADEEKLVRAISQSLGGHGNEMDADEADMLDEDAMLSDSTDEMVNLSDEDSEDEDDSEFDDSDNDDNDDSVNEDEDAASDKEDQHRKLYPPQPPANIMWRPSLSIIDQLLEEDHKAPGRGFQARLQRSRLKHTPIAPNASTEEDSWDFDVVKKKSASKLQREKEETAGKKKRRQRLGNEFANMDLDKLNRSIQNFVADSRLDCLPMQAMSKRCRQTVHILSALYNVRSSSIGGGEKRQPVLYRTPKTKLPDAELVMATLEDLRSRMPAPSYEREPRTPKNKKQQQKLEAKERRRSGSSSVGRGKRAKSGPSPRHSGGGGGGSGSMSAASLSAGTVIGSNAPEVHEESIGGRLLRSMGWTPGQGIGVEGNVGRTQPIEAVVRVQRSGLGHRSSFGGF